MVFTGQVGRVLLRQSEVKQLDRTRLGNENIRRFQVAMDDSLGVSVFKRGRNL